MRRNVRGHADGDTAGAIDEEVREARRKHGRLAFGAVIVVGEIDGVLVDVRQKLVRHFVQARFGVTHGGRRIRVHRAEVALAVDQRQAHRPRLRQTGQCIVDRAVAMGVILTHDVADDTTGLAVGTTGNVARFLAGIENTAVNRLKAVAHVGQGAAHDHAHRVIEIARLHLIDDVDAGIFAFGTEVFGAVDVGVVAHALDRSLLRDKG